MHAKWWGFFLGRGEAMHSGITDLLPNKRSARQTEKIIIFAKFYAAYDSMTGLWLCMICLSISRWNTVSKEVDDTAC